MLVLFLLVDKHLLLCALPFKTFIIAEPTAEILGLCQVLFQLFSRDGVHHQTMLFTAG